MYQFNSPEGYVIERIYIAGYMDGSVRIWDATSPVLSILCVIGAVSHYLMLNFSWVKEDFI